MEYKGIKELEDRIRCAKGDRKADLVLKNATIVNVFTGKLQKRDIAICDGVIAGVGEGYEGKVEEDLNGLYAIPGLIDAHMHIESSMLTPLELSNVLVHHGTTCVIADPHEIANVMGAEGIRFMIDNAKEAILDYFFMLPSCVPATHLETSGAYLGWVELVELAKYPCVLGLAEMMNYPGVLNCDNEVLKKIEAFQGKIIDGHCPGLSKKELQAYICSGIGSDHESVDPDEAVEKIENGLFLMIREGSTAKNMEAIVPVIDRHNFFRACFVSDDLHPEDIVERGHLDFVLKKAVSLGIDPIMAIQMTTLNPASYFGLRERGSISAGKKADIVVVNNLEEFQIVKVYKDGKEVKKEDSKHAFKSFNNTMNIRGFSQEKLKIPYSEQVRVVEIIPDQIINREVIVNPKSKDGWIISDPERDILKICVVERHKGTGNVGVGLVKGLGIKKGAIASSVSHDSHNIIAVGVEDSDIYRAVLEVAEMNGGMVVVSEGKPIAKLRLEVAGLMTQRPIEILIEDIEGLKKGVEYIGSKVKNPFMTLSFLALPVIPELRITDKGLVDVNNFRFTSLSLK